MAYILPYICKSFSFDKYLPPEKEKKKKKRTFIILLIYPFFFGGDFFFFHTKIPPTFFCIAESFQV